MAKEREIRKETTWLGNEKEVIYENGVKVGDLRLEERGGFLGIGSDTVKVEYNTSGEEVGYTKREERGGFCGIGTSEVEVRYDTHNEEIGHSKVEERGGVLGIGTHHVRVEYDNDGNEASQTNWEKRGGVCGIGADRVRVTRYSDSSSSSYGSYEYTGGTSDSDSGGLIKFFLGAIGLIISLSMCTSMCSNRTTAPVRQKQASQEQNRPVKKAKKAHKHEQLPVAAETSNVKNPEYQLPNEDAASIDNTQRQHKNIANDVDPSGL